MLIHRAIIVAVGLHVGAALAQPADLTFDIVHADQRTDGAALTLAEIDRVVISVQGGGYLAEIPSNQDSTVVTSFMIDGGECFEAVTVDTIGLQSEAAVICIPARPGRPRTINLRVRFN